MSAPKLLIVVNDLPFFISHRLPIAIAARETGFEVAVAAPQHLHASILEQAGIRFFDLPMPRKRGSLAGEIRAILSLWRIISDFRPGVAHLVTAKPIIFGGAICRLRAIPIVAAISGLGHVFVFDDLRSRLARLALLAGYSLALDRRHAIAIFQNADNLAVFERAGIVNERHVMIRGSGTDLRAFAPSPADNPVPIVILPARMLWTKGVGEFVDAARLLRNRNYRARFVLAGNGDPGNPANIDEAQLRDWTKEGAVEWIGYQADIAAILSTVDLVVLPSYLEGLPKTIVDASAAGRAVVTTDVPGCRDAIVDGETGLLCEVRNPTDLADKIAALLDDPQRRLRMARQARLFAEQEFDIGKVIDAHLTCYRALLREKASA